MNFTNDSANLFAMYPHAVANPHYLTFGAANTFARVRTLQSTATTLRAIRNGSESSMITLPELRENSSGYRRIESSSNNSLTVQDALILSHNLTEIDGPIELKATFGNVIWPVYPPHEQSDFTFLKPILPGLFPSSTLENWAASATDKYVKHYFHTW
jgi:hypothetical protein